MTPRHALRKFVEGFPSQEAAADAIRVSPALVSMWLSGARRPGLLTAIRLQALAGIPAEDWLSRTRKRRATPVQP